MTEENLFIDCVLVTIPTAWELIASMVIWMLCFFAGFMLTENQNTALWLHIQAFDMKPFSCRKCLSTHLTWLSFLFAAYAGGWHFLYLGAMGSWWMYYILNHRHEE